MRHSRLAMLAAALTLAAPARAGVVGTYAMGEAVDRAGMVIEVNDRGEVRVTSHIEQITSVMLILNGEAYMVESDAEGRYAVTLADAFEVGMAEFDRDDRRPAPDRPSPPAPPPPPQPPQPPAVPAPASRIGPETVAGRPGTLWRLPVPHGRAASRDDEIVISSEPELAPLGIVFRPRGASAAGPDPDDRMAARAALLGRGAPLREGRHLRLVRAEVRPIAEAFVLPALLDRAAYQARRERARRARLGN